MNFQCKNCGGNMVYSPKFKAMYCPFCDGQDCEEKKGDDSLVACPSCGGELTVGKFTSASKCPYCNNYIVFDKRVEKVYKPDEIIPFSVSKEDAVQAMEREFKRRTFAPASFLSEKSLETLQGRYVPFFLYDYTADTEYRATATKVRTWSSGNYDYTETSYYNVIRDLNAVYDNIPADASEEMPDKTMDLMEPYDYSEFLDFDPKYMSGFFGEIYNDNASAYEERAKKKAIDSSRAIVDSSVSGYSTVSPIVNTTTLKGTDVDFALFPVWVYNYKWAGKLYPFYVNGQTGKVVGETPVSKLKVLLYGLTVAGCSALIIQIILRLVELV